MTRALALMLALYAAGARAADPEPAVALHHQVLAGDSWWALAERYWGDAGLGREFALFVAGDAEAPLEPESVLAIPLLQMHEIRPGDTLRRIARSHYGDDALAPALARVNELSDPDALEVGQSLLVPVVEPRPRSAAPEAGLAAPKAGATSPKADPAARRTRVAAPAEAGLDEQLRYARNAYMDGSFDSALERLEKLRAAVLARGDRDQQALLLRTLSFVYVAFERPADACDSIRALKEIDASTQWSPELVSPKILQVVSACSKPAGSAP